MAEQAGKLFARSDRTVEKRLGIVDAAEQEPEKYQPLVEDMNRTGSQSGLTSQKIKK